MTAGLVPNRALFAFKFALRRFAKPPRIDGALRDWTDAFLLPDLSQLERHANYAQVWAGWDDVGLYFAVRVRKKKLPSLCDHDQFWNADGFRVWIDARDNKAIHRPGRFCRQFCLFPDDFTVRMAAVPRATEEPPAADSGLIRAAGKRLSDGWAAEFAVPSALLHGLDPVEQPRIGLYYHLRDRERGEQFLTLGEPFPFWFDPSVWATAELDGGRTPTEAPVQPRVTRRPRPA